MLSGRMFLGRLGLTASILVLVTSAAPTAQADPINLASCSSEGLEQPFLPWLDSMYYRLVPNGGFENGSTSWTLNGNAQVVSGNETYRVNAASDSHSLYLDSSSSAKTGTVCVGALDPTLRLFVLNAGSPLSTLKVEVLFTDTLGTSRSASIGLLMGTGSWKPTLPLAFLANLAHPPAVTDGKVAVAFRFTPRGSAGRWKIDDVYVDPFKGR
jgi:hypothetical protein